MRCDAIAGPYCALWRGGGPSCFGPLPVQPRTDSPLQTDLSVSTLPQPPPTVGTERLGQVG